HRPHRNQAWPARRTSAGLIVLGPHGIPILLWPEGTTHAEIARARGEYWPHPHPAGEIALTLRGDEIANLINSKLASHLSATDRLSDASDVQRLIKRLKLPLDYAKNLAPEVRGAFVRVWKGELR